MTQSLLNALSPFGATRAREIPGSTEAIFTFNLLNTPSGLSWQKGIQCDTLAATPQSVLFLLNDWKRNTLLSLDFAHPSDTIQYAIKCYGEQAVREVLKPCNP